ncbi:MAG: hypothetical protein WDM71_10030 [Ferruginibacter sp.]
MFGLAAGATIKTKNNATNPTTVAPLSEDELAVVFTSAANAPVFAIIRAEVAITPFNNPFMFLFLN